MKRIVLEEHFAAGLAPGVSLPRGKEAFLKGTCTGAPFHTDKGLMADIGEKRLAFMDQYGVDVQVLCSTSGQSLGSEDPVGNCRKINDYLASKIKEHPDRFTGYACLPTSVPEACADELERAVKELGLCGTMVAGRLEDGTYLNDEKFEPLFAKAEELDVPIAIHPAVPPQPVIDACYSRGLPEKTGVVLSEYGFGWHVDPATHALNLILSGVFDRHPNLKIVLGHWGELLPYFVDRFDDAFPAEFTGLNHVPSYYIKNNIYVTPSGIYSKELLEYNLKVMGPDHILLAMDFPWTTPEGIDELLAGLSEEDAEKISYKNAEKLLHL